MNWTSGLVTPAAARVMSDGQHEALEVLARSQTAPHRQVQRAEVLLLAADGAANTQIAAQVGVHVATMRSWRVPSAEEGPAKLGKVRAGRGPKPTIPQDTIEEIVDLTPHSKPDGPGHWSCHTMAKKVGVSPATVQRVWSARGLKPYLVHAFTLSNDPRFAEKLIDVVGLHLAPPDNAVVVCVDERPSAQALDRTQPSLPLKKCRAATRTYDDKSNGTTTLFAPLEVLTGKVIGKCMGKNRHEEFLKFLRTVEREVPTGVQVHLICDNHATDEHADITAWLTPHPRFHTHFTPTSSSWPNLVERWFRELTDNAQRRVVFHSAPDLIAEIEQYLQAHDEDPKPFLWTATTEDILAKVARGRVAVQAANQ